MFGVILVSAFANRPARAGEEADTLTFPIRGFAVEGNTLLAERTVYDALAGFAGENKTAEDVETARDRLEQIYHKTGYPAVLVNIPEQTVEDGIVTLEVIESRIRRVRITGNRYHTMAKIREALPSIAEGEILYVPRVQEELAKLNRGSDIKVSPVLVPGRELGTIDIELKVKDKLPLHGSLELNNRTTHDTSELRLNGMIRYDNLWQKDHSVSLQYQTSPQELSEVQVLAGSYVFPTPWNRDHLVALFGVWSDSETAFGEGFKTIGAGNLFGIRYVMPLEGKGAYSHNLTLGFDYKDFEETLGFEDQGQDEGVKSPITYAPFSVAYSSFYPDSTGRTQFSVGLNWLFRGLRSDLEEFALKRFRAKGNYLYVTAGVERSQELPRGLTLFVKLDGQLANQPLLSNEQYSAGGMESVRGYLESEEVGDNAFHGSIELMSPDLSGIFGIWDKFQFSPYVFYDHAELWIKDALPEQDNGFTLRGTGVGARGTVTDHFEYQVDWAVALAETRRVEKGDQTVYFQAKWLF